MVGVLESFECRLQQEFVKRVGAFGIESQMGEISNALAESNKRSAQLVDVLTESGLSNVDSKVERRAVR